jgi:hypothetical protein
MAQKRYSGADRREVERGGELKGQGMTIPQSCMRLGISDHSHIYERWCDIRLAWLA